MLYFILSLSCLLVWIALNNWNVPCAQKRKIKTNKAAEKPQQYYHRHHNSSHN